jgi:hypothetical protein
MSSARTLVGAQRSKVGEQLGRRRLLFVIAAVLVVAVGAFWAARGLFGPGSAPESWVDGVAQVGSDEFSIEYDGWTYGSDLHVMSWIDSSGSWHDQGIPPCLRTEPGASVPVRFQVREVTVDHLTWRPIVSIACR